MIVSMLRRWWLSLCTILGICLSLLSLLFLPTGTVHADEGAPNLTYAVGSGSDYQDIAVIDIARQQIIQRIHVGGTPNNIILSTDSRFAYVTQLDNNSVAVIDTNTWKVTETVPTGSHPVALALDTAKVPLLYVANKDSDTITVIDSDQHKTIATIPVDLHPVALGIAGSTSGIKNPDDPQLFVANNGSDTLTIYSTTTRTLLATVALPGAPTGIIIPTAGGVAYVTLSNSKIYGVDLVTRALIGPLLDKSGDVFGKMDVDPVSGHIYVPDSSQKVVWNLNPVPPVSDKVGSPIPAEPAHVIAVDGSPSAVAITYDGSHGFIANQDNGSITVFDATNQTVKSTIAIGGQLTAITTGSYPPVLDRRSTSIVGYVVTAIVLIAISLGGLAIIRRRLQHPDVLTEELEYNDDVQYS
jgi:YVTN family beta-propeller protein